MAITRGATLSSNSRTATGTDASVTHTVDVGSTLLIVSTFYEAAETVTATPSWSGNGTPQDLTLIDATTSSGNSADMAMETWALINPTAEVGGSVTVTHSENDNFITTATNYLGTNTVSVAAATNFLAEDVNDTATGSTVFGSAGTTGNTLYFAAGFKGDDGVDGDVAPPTSFFEIFEGASGTSANADIAAYVCDFIGGAAAAATLTWAVTDENSGHYIEIVPGVSGSGTPSITKPTASGAGKLGRKSSGTPSITKPTASGSAFIWPRVYLNTTETKSGATEMTVTAANAAGTSITFTDPAGAPTGSLKLGVERQDNDQIGWIDVTVNTAGADLIQPPLVHSFAVTRSTNY